MDKNVYEMLIKEHEELGEKLQKLIAFNNSEKFTMLDDENQALLLIQESAMGTYCNTLKMRIDINKEK